MAKKLKSKTADREIADKITESAKDIWLAGLAAFERAQKEGGKVFDSLVKEGRKVEARTRELADVNVDEVIDEVKTKATETLDKVGGMLEERVVQVLNQLGVPRSDDLDSVRGRVESLEQRLKDFTGASKSKPAATAKPAQKAAAEARGSDDLKAIAGIGPTLEKQLNDQGLSTYRQIAELTGADIDRLEAAGLRVTARLRRDNWIAQAKEQHFKKYDEKL
jgi:poly(hydroxyalkanoate) granule-associated protein